ncbi:MAG TPA: HD domain-containing phosphohydrolase [Verrucomicrobiae bacterium]|jgi:HD-GYP domain-containing protein (c-di-GMP phosphodiesterase class II)|nr:HD domain-containing phosphohydrolase [Verrucomicrobiae bacterium]
MPLFVYGKGTDLGTFPELLTKAGLDVREVDFARLAKLGGIAALQGQSWAIAVASAKQSDAHWLEQDEQVVAILRPPLDRASLLTAVRTAKAYESAALQQRYAAESNDLLEIARALSSERNLPVLQQLIVRKARELTGADGGSLYVVEEGDHGKQLRFNVAQTGPRDRGVFLGSILPHSTHSIAGYVTLTGQPVRIADVYALDEALPYRFNDSFDRASSYRTKSMMCVPMRNVNGDTVGAIQLINRKPQFDILLSSPEQTLDVVEPFDDHDEQILLGLASQAAVAMENARLVEAIEDLFEKFVRASVKAIEVRDAATQGHSERVATLTVAQAEAINAIETGPFAGMHFSPEHLREVRYASLLHDFGKVAVPEYIFGKAKKLPDGRLDTVRLRFLLAIEQSAGDEERAALRELLEKIEASNEPSVLASQADAALTEARSRLYRDGVDVRPLIDDAEYHFLTIPRGSLSDQERERMQEHVTQSFLFLREIPWQTTPWPNVADLAYGHHEHLDGTGYPRKLAGDAIVPQVRMMTISDVFDALTASDRPYKKALSAERAIDILTKEFAQRGKIDELLLDVFVTKKIYETTCAVS